MYDGGMGQFLSLFGGRIARQIGSLAMGAIVALLILVYQLRSGIILRAYEEQAWFSVIWPYSFAILGVMGWEALMTWLILRNRASAIGAEEAALFRHYSACSSRLASLLETIWHHWNGAGLTLAHPLGENGTETLLTQEVEAFKVLYHNHLDYLAFEIPEFDSSALPGIPSDAEYIKVVRALRVHGRQLADAAKFVEEDSK